MFASTSMSLEIVSKKTNPATSEVNYSKDEREFLKAVEEYRSRGTRRYMTAVDYLRVAKSIGYQRVGFSC